MNRKIMSLIIVLIFVCLSQTGLADDSILVHWKCDSDTLDSFQSSDGGAVFLNNAEFTLGKEGDGIEIQSGATPYFIATHGNNIDLDKGAISFWYRASDIPSSYATLFQAGESCGKFTLYRYNNDNVLKFYYNYTYNYIYPSVNIFDGEWHHIRLSWDNSLPLAYIYIDSILEGGMTIKSYRPCLDGDHFYVGNGNDGEDYSAGIIDEFHISSDPTFEISSFPDDSDGDGLSDDEEASMCTDPDDGDTDDDGIRDGAEDRNGNGIVDLGETDPCNIDTDNDGIQDGTEIGYTLNNIGPDTDTALFQEDLDPSTVTDPLNADTDGDGVDDGAEDANQNGMVDDGETDPNLGLDDRILVYWKADSPLLDLYRSRDGRYVTLNNAAFTPGKEGDGIEIQSGATPYFIATHGNNIDLDKGAISFWYRASDIPSSYATLFQAGESCGKFTLYRYNNDNVLKFYYNWTYNYIYPSVNIFDGDWHHILLSWDNSLPLAYIYIDSVLEGTMTIQSCRPCISGDHFYVGNRNKCDYNCAGIIDELYIFGETIIQNYSPVANDDIVSTDEDTPVTTVNVLLNDTDPDNDTLNIASFTDPSNGVIVENGDGTFTYTPNPNYYGEDAFTYTASDGNGGTDSATVTITINSVNDPPVAVDDYLTTDQDTPAVTDNLLANDTDADNDILTISGFTQASNGSVTDNGDGSFTYTPDPLFYGEDSFTYTVSDGNGGADTGNVTITVIEVIYPPNIIFSASPASIIQGESSILSWDSSNADTVTIDQGIGSVDLDGSITVYPAETTTYTITAVGPGGTTTANATVDVIINESPSITVLEPSVEDVIDCDFTIEWTDEDPDDNALISLYYDTDNSGDDGVLIVGGLRKIRTGLTISIIGMQLKYRKVIIIYMP